MDIKEAARIMSKKGASKGGKARMAKLSPAQRKRLSEKANRARWGKKS